MRLPTPVAPLRLLRLPRPRRGTGPLARTACSPQPGPNRRLVPSTARRRTADGTAPRCAPCSTPPSSSWSLRATRPETACLYSHSWGPELFSFSCSMRCFFWGCGFLLHWHPGDGAVALRGLCCRGSGFSRRPSTWVLCSLPSSGSSLAGRFFSTETLPRIFPFLLSALRRPASLSPS